MAPTSSGTPAKKATPSLSNLLGKEKDKDSNEEAIKKDEETPKGTSTDVPEENLDRDDDPVNDDKNNDPFLSPHVVSTVPNKTPNELSAETPDETAQRYNIDNKVTKEDAENPRVQVYKDTVVKQVPSGTHLHPDVAKDLSNRGISQHTTDSAQVSRSVIETHDFAGDAEYNDKF